jgi:hypothetical protein
MKKFILFSVIVMAAIGVQAQPPKVPADAGASFGEKTTVENAITVDQLFANMQSAEKKAMPVKLKGVVTEVCQMEGCWIKVKSS